MNSRPSRAMGPVAVGGAIAGCLDSCAQARALVDALTPAQYVHAEQGQSSIGAHMRHCMDHFLCFLRGLDAGEINYDARDRDEALENDREVFQRVVSDVCEALSALDGANLSRPLVMRQIPAPGFEPVFATSTIDRELLFLMSHCIHHVAIAKVLARAWGITMPANLGVAYSTVAWKNSTEDNNASS